MSTNRELRVAIIGAGMSGILAAIKLREAGIDNIVVYEKADRIGGTWREHGAVQLGTVPLSGWRWKMGRLFSAGGTLCNSLGREAQATA